ncbi:MAG TPA: hypothetical protein VF157_15610 [Chloroflexota bacterium]
MKVRVLQLGRKVMDYEGPDGATLSTTLEALSIAAGQGMDLRVNSQPATLETILHESDVVTVIPRIKGGSGPIVYSGPIPWK